MFQACRDCGCTNLSACDGGCWWVEDDLCSSCAVAVDVETGGSLTAEELAGWSVSDSGLVLPPGAVG